MYRHQGASVHRLHEPVLSSKIKQKCGGLSTPFQRSQEKQTKIIYTIVYRDTINVSDSQMACVKTPPPLEKRAGASFHRLRMILESVAYRALYTKLSLGDLCSRLQIRLKHCQYFCYRFGETLIH